MAAETTTKQMALTRNAGFMERVVATLDRAATFVLIEPLLTPFHAERAAYAKLVIENPLAKAQQAGPQVVMGVNVIATTTYDETFGVASCSILDIDLEAQINTLFNGLAGIDQAV
jgi:hypothetical protein